MSSRAARDVSVTLGLGVLLLLAVGGVILTRSPSKLVRINTRQTVLGGTTINDAEVCQANEVLPAGVSAMRLGVGSYFGAKIRLRALSDSLVLTEGGIGPTWTGTSVTVPVKPIVRATAHVTICINVAPNSELIFFRGEPASAGESASYDTGALLGGRLAIEYLAPSQRSWWSRIMEVARRMGLGHALSGTWVAVLVALLVAAVAALAVGLSLRELS